jgi:hypothetical protein
MAIGIICSLAVLVVVCIVALSGFFPGVTEEERTVQECHAATRQVDEVLRTARIRMEEATGARRPGERRIGDSIHGSWRNW